VRKERAMSATTAAIAITVILGIIVWLTDNPLRRHRD